MSQQIDANFVQAYSNTFYETGQQMSARFAPFVMLAGGIVGASKAMERVGKVDAYDITSRHADTRYVETPHSRRWLDLTDKGAAELVDEMDEIRLLADPKSKYPKIMVQALNRAKDDVIYAAIRGTARTGGGTQVLPSAQKIAEGGTGLTLAKLLTAKELLDAAEIETDEGQDMTGQGPTPSRVIACSSKQLTNLYGTTEIKNIDYNSVKALAEGQINTFLGFRFIRSERLAKSGTTRYAVAWCKPAVALGIDPADAAQILAEVREGVSTWQREAKALKLPPSQIRELSARLTQVATAAALPATASKPARPRKNL